MRSAMEPVPIRPWALCIRAQPYSKSLERGGIWIWIIILLLATAAAAGGVFYREGRLGGTGDWLAVKFPLVGAGPRPLNF